MKYGIYPLVIIICLSAFVCSCDNGSRKIIDETKFFMGTVIDIKVSIIDGTNEKKIREAINNAFHEIKRIEDIFSVYKENSEISRINKLRKNEKLQISHEVFALIKKSLEFSARTDGAFDITVKPLVDLWKKAKEKNKLPDEEEVRDALAHTGYKNVVLDEARLTIFFKKDGMALDLGGIAKGYATDRAVEILIKNNIKNAIVRSGGNIYCLGRKSNNELWKIGLQHPREKNRMFMEIKIENNAIDTSGDYEKYFLMNGKRYSHIIDPRSGYPIGDNVVSSTVIAPDAATADILATSLEVMGSKGLAIVESVKGVDAVIVQKRNDKFIVNMTDGINKRYEIIEEKI